MLFVTVDMGLLLSLLVRLRNNDKLLVSHLLFVYDILIFCEANLNHVIFALPLMI
jgi:hypothetical protein